MPIYSSMEPLNWLSYKGRIPDLSSLELPQRLVAFLNLCHQCSDVSVFWGIRISGLPPTTPINQPFLYFTVYYLNACHYTYIPHIITNWVLTQQTITPDKYNAKCLKIHWFWNRRFLLELPPLVYACLILEIPTSTFDLISMGKPKRFFFRPDFIRLEVSKQCLSSVVTTIFEQYWIDRQLELRL